MIGRLRHILPLAAAALLSAGPLLAAEVSRPNILLILADDLGWGDLGVQGSRAVVSPNIDALAQEGVRLTDFYASAPVCTPSRAGLLTGRYPPRTGLASVLSAAGDSFTRAAMRRLAWVSAEIGATTLRLIKMLTASAASNAAPAANARASLTPARKPLNISFSVFSIMLPIMPCIPIMWRWKALGMAISTAMANTTIPTRIMTR